MFFHIFTSEPTCLLGVINICRVARTSKSGLSRLVVAKAGCKSEKLEVTIFVSAAYVLKTSKPRLIPTPTPLQRLCLPGVRRQICTDPAGVGRPTWKMTLLLYRQDSRSICGMRTRKKPTMFPGPSELPSRDRKHW